MGVAGPEDRRASQCRAATPRCSSSLPAAVVCVHAPFRTTYPYQGTGRLVTTIDSNTHVSSSSVRLRTRNGSSTAAPGNDWSLSQTPTNACPCRKTIKGFKPDCSKHAAMSKIRSRQVPTRVRQTQGRANCGEGDYAWAERRKLETHPQTAEMVPNQLSARHRGSRCSRLDR